MTDQEINEAVARELGWKCDGHPRKCVDDAGSDFAYSYFQCSVCEVTPWPECGPHPVPDYCHSIAAAWEVVTKAEVFKLHFDWRAEGLHWSCWYDNHLEVSDTAPMAICLAFLKLNTGAKP